MQLTRELICRFSSHIYDYRDSFPPPSENTISRVHDFAVIFNAFALQPKDSIHFNSITACERCGEFISIKSW